MHGCYRLLSERKGEEKGKKRDVCEGMKDDEGGGLQKK